MRLQGKLQANRGCVTLQRRGCRSNSGLEILRRTRSFPGRTSSAGSVAAILWQLGIYVYRESQVRNPSQREGEGVSRRPPGEPGPAAESLLEVGGLLHHELGELQRTSADLGGHAHAGLAAVRLERLHEGQEPL